jgi:hypothetical protein
MSEENIEIARRVIDAFTLSDLDAALQDNDREIVCWIGRGREDLRQASTTDARQSEPSGAPSLTRSIRLS